MKKIHKYFIISLLILLLIAVFLDSFILNKMVLLEKPAFVEFFRAITLLGEYHIAIIYAFFVFISIKQTRKEIYLLLVSFVISGALAYFFKAIIPRERPVLALINEGLSSFPSGHSVFIFTPLALLNEINIKIKGFFLLIAIIIAFSRLYLRVHYLTDIVAGALIGYLSGLLAIYLNELYKKGFFKAKSS